jgi:hypothetical protein
VSECYHEASIMRLWPTRGCCAIGENKFLVFGLVLKVIAKKELWLVKLLDYKVAPNLKC